MPARRLLMRKIREVLRLRHELGLSHQAVARASAVGVGTVNRYLRRAAEDGLGWPLPTELDDAALEARLFPRAAPVHDRVRPDCAHIHRELKRDGVTLQLLWEGGRGARTPAEVARESGLPELEVLLALEALGRLLDDRPRARGDRPWDRPPPLQARGAMVRGFSPQCGDRPWRALLRATPPTRGLLVGARSCPARAGVVLLFARLFLEPVRVVQLHGAVDRCGPLADRGPSAVGSRRDEPVGRVFERRAVGQVNLDRF